MRKNKKSIEIKIILERIAKDLAAAVGWGLSASFQAASNHINSAEAFIELIESWDCGSIGGFGIDNEGKPQQTNGGSLQYADKYHPLFARFVWLYKKYVKDDVNEADLFDMLSHRVVRFWMDTRR
jgi:hypothetical protein